MKIILDEFESASYLNREPNIDWCVLIVPLIIIIYIIASCKVTGTIFGPFLWGISILRWIVGVIT